MGLVHLNERGVFTLNPGCLVLGGQSKNVQSGHEYQTHLQSLSAVPGDVHSPSMKFEREAMSNIDVARRCTSPHAMHLS